MKTDGYPVASLFPEGFVTPRLAVSPFRPGDVSEMGAGFEAPSVWRFSRGIDSVGAAGAWLQSTPDDPTRAAFAVRWGKTCALAGFCVLSRWGADRVEVGGWLAPFFWNRGVGGELLKEMRRRTTDAKGRCPLVAEVDPANDRAVHLLRRAGFVLDGGLWVAR